MKHIVKRRITGPDAPALGEVTVVSSSALTVTLDRAATGPTRLQEYVLERRAYGSTSFTELARGIDIFGAGSEFPDTGLVANTEYEYRCKVIDTTLRESEWCAPAFGSTAAATTILPPINVAATSIAGGIQITWDAPASGLAPTSYELQRTYAVGGTWNVLATQAGTSYDDTGLTEGQQKWYRLVSISSGNRSDYSATVTAAAGAPVAPTEKSWTPGHYFKTQGDHSSVDQAAYWASVTSAFSNSLNTTFPLQGNYATIAWGAFNTTGSTFDGTQIDSALAWHVTNSKRLILEISAKNFRTAVGLTAPADLIASGDVVRTNTGWIAAVWRPAVMDRYIAAVQWVAAHYDGHSNLEMVCSFESAPSTPQAADYSVSAYATQLKRLIAAAEAAFVQNFAVIPLINNLSGQVVGLIDTALVSGTGFGSPDCRPTSESILLFAGTPASNETPTGDYRERMAHYETASTSAHDYYTGNPAGLINFAQQYKVTHLAWTKPIDDLHTWTDCLNAMVADPLLHSTYPTG